VTACPHTGRSIVPRPAGPHQAGGLPGQQHDGGPHAGQGCSLQGAGRALAESAAVARRTCAALSVRPAKPPTREKQPGWSWCVRADACVLGGWVGWWCDRLSPPPRREPPLPTPQLPTRKLGGTPEHDPVDSGAEELLPSETAHPPPSPWPEVLEPEPEVGSPGEHGAAAGAVVTPPRSWLG
jgi:hypothetical protein